MAIKVICPGCHQRFQVSDSYAGQTGPCPKCKTAIRIPTKDEEVKVHDANQTLGEIALKPIEREKTKLTPQILGGIAGGTLGALAFTFLLQATGLFASSPIVAFFALFLIGPPLTFGAYHFLRNDEMKPFEGRTLYYRSIICAAVYTLMWIPIYKGLGMLSLGMVPDLWMWGVVFVPAIVIGGGVALLCFDLEFGAGCFHFGFYLIVSIIFRWAAGFGWIWNFGVGVTNDIQIPPVPPVI